MNINDSGDTDMDKKVHGLTLIQCSGYRLLPACNQEGTQKYTSRLYESKVRLEHSRWLVLLELMVPPTCGRVWSEMGKSRVRSPIWPIFPLATSSRLVCKLSPGHSL